MTKDEFNSFTSNIPGTVLCIKKFGSAPDVFYSNSIKDCTGYTPEEIIRMPGNHFSIVHEDDFQTVKKKYTELQTNHEASNGTIKYRINSKNGDIHWLRENLRIQWGSENNIEQIISSIVDVTDLTNENEIIKGEFERIQEVNFAKDKFISIVAHDLRAPFTSLLGFTEILLNEPDLPEEEKNEYLNYINDASKNQLLLINYLLDWSRLQTGRVAVESRRLNLSTIIQNISIYLSGTVIQKKINFKVNIPEDLYIFADEKLINQVFTNLISNSIKFTPEGKSIIVSAQRFKEGMVEAVVSDDGLGIPEEDQDKLFKLEHKVSTPGTRGEKGTGLGLTLVKEIVEKHGGDIWFYSEISKGTSFHITVPEAKNLVLIVEDDASTRQLYKRILSKVVPNFELIEANNGYEAMSQIVDTIPSLVITDHSMPLMNGYQLIEAIREKEEAKNIPVIVVSAKISDQLLEEYQKLGVDKLIKKPFDSNELSQAISQIIV